MTVIQFKRLANVLSIILKLISGLIGLSILAVGILWFVDRHALLFSTPRLLLPLFSIKRNVPEDIEFLASGIIFLINSLICSYLFFKSSFFFERLSNGQTPFSLVNYRLLKMIGLLTALTGLSVPIVYSSIVTLLLGTVYITIGLNTQLILGVMIYFTAEIIHYGVSLQELADETV